MRKLLLIVFVLIVCVLGGAYYFQNEIKMFSLRGDLQSLLDYACSTPKKTAYLFGLEYRLEKPVLLEAKHSGLKIEGQGAVITGAKKITNWRRSSRFKNAWEADLKYDKFITSVFVNGLRAGCARTPNDTRFLAYSRIEDGSQHGSREGMYVSTSQGGDVLAELTPNQLKDCFVGSFRNWVQVNVPLKSIEKARDSKKLKVLFASPIGTSMFRNCKYPNFVVYNIPSALDKAGEFYFDRANSKIYYIPRENEDMATAQVEFPYVEEPFKIQGMYNGKRVERVKDIFVNSVVFSGGSVGYHKDKLKKGELFFLNDGQSSASSISCVNVAIAENIRFENCIFTQTDSYGLWLGIGVKNSKVSNCIIRDVGLGGIKVGFPAQIYHRVKVGKNVLEHIATNNIEIVDNAIYNYGRFSMSGAGILAFDVAKCKIEHNEIFDGFYTGISYGWCWGAGKTYTKDSSISYNKIHDLSFGNTNDIGGIYTLGTSPNSKIEGNVIYNIECLDYGAWGIYNDEGSNGWIISKNYVCNSSKGGYFMHYGKDCKIFNNIIRDCRDYQVGLGRKLPKSYIFERNIVEFSSPATVLRGDSLIPPSAAQFDNNIYYDKTGNATFGGLSFKDWQATGQDKNSYIAKLDIDTILRRSLPVKKIGFEPIDISKVGIRGALREKIETVLKNYKYPPMFKPNFQLTEIEVEDKMIGRYPASSGGMSGEDSLMVLAEDNLRFLRITDTHKDFRPYFSYKFSLDNSNFVKVLFNARLNEKSRLLLELRPSLGGGAGFPQMRLINATLGKQKLPLNKWLKFEIVVPNHVNADKKLLVKVFDSDKEILSKVFPYTTNAAKFYTAFFIAFGGGNGEIIDISNVRIKPVK